MIEGVWKKMKTTQMINRFSGKELYNYNYIDPLDLLIKSAPIQKLP